MKQFIFILLSFFIIASCATSKWTPTSQLIPDNVQDVTPTKGEKLVIIYSTKWCYWCKVAKEWMKENNIEYLDQDFANPLVKKQLKEYADSIGYTERLDAVPIFVIEKKILIGYNPKQILCEIGRHKCFSKRFTTWETPMRKK